MTEERQHCKNCGKLEWTRYIDNDGLCVNCYFWSKHESAKNSPQSVRVNGYQYFIGGEIDCNLHFKGHGGKLFTILFEDGRMVKTTNLWYNGQIPDHFKSQLPNNAVFL